MANPREPFSRLPVVDLQTAAQAVSDIYDKLNVLALQLQKQGQQPQQPAQAAQPQAPGVRTFTLSTMLTAQDKTLLGTVAVDSSVVLPDAATVRDKSFTITNALTSTGDLNFQSPAQQRISGALASTYTLTPGQSITIQSIGSGWIAISQV